MNKSRRTGAAPKIAVIGAGAMAGALMASLERGDGGLQIGAALVRRSPGPPASGGVAVFTDVARLLAWTPDLAVECAGHGAVRGVVPSLLEAGVDVVLASVGALADAALFEDLQTRARHAGSRLILASGAIGGLDALQAAARAGLDRVTYVGRKPPAAWKGTPGEVGRDLDRLDGPTVLFEGSAAEAALLYTKNANVVMAVALAGAGPDRTTARLIADPDAATNAHEVRAEGDFGRLSFSIENRPLPANPRTSLLAALSIEQAIRRWRSPFMI